MSIVTEETAKNPNRFAEVKDPTLLNRVPQSYHRTKNCKVTAAEVGVCANVVIRILKKQGIPMGNEAAKKATRYCDCGTRIRTEHNQCGACRKAEAAQADLLAQAELGDHCVEYIRRGPIKVPVAVYDPEPDGPARKVHKRVLYTIPAEEKAA